MAIHIAFDERPGNGGPARYVAALARGLESLEWRVSYVAEPTRLPSHVVTGMTMPKERRSLLGSVTPRFARHWSGFRRDAKQLATQISRMPADIFHTQNTGCEEAPVAARLARMRNVLGTFHVDSTYDLEHQRSGMAHRAMEWYSNRCLHRAIAVSEATKRDWMRRTGIAADRVVTIHNGIDPAQFGRRQSQAAARGQLGLPADALVLGGLGRLDAAKGFGFLIEALGLLATEFPHVAVAIAGSGALRERLEAQAAKLGLEKRVFFLGFQPDVNLVLDACDVFVLSSLCEALPFALLEAMAHELPAVGTSVGGVPEVIVPGETGLLSAPRDAVALAGAIRPLLASAELRERMGRSGRERVIKHFRERDMVAKTISVYREMLKPSLS